MKLRNFRYVNHVTLVLASCLAILAGIGLLEAAYAAVGNLGDASFTFDPNKLSPRTGNPYSSGGGNVVKLLENIVKFLLIAITTVSVIMIAIAGMVIAASGTNPEMANKGKAAVRYNLIAV